MIPKIIVQTSYSKKPEEHVLDKFKSLTGADWEYFYYSDSGALEYLRLNAVDEFPDIVKKYSSIRTGAHRADLFRYYYLYKNGGVYIDSDAMLLQDINYLVDNYDFFTVEDQEGKCFNGLIGSSPSNPIIKKALEDALSTDLKELLENYHVLCENLFKILETSDKTNTKILYEERSNLLTDEFNQWSTVGITYDSATVTPVLIHYFQTKIVPEKNVTCTIQPFKLNTVPDSAIIVAQDGKSYVIETTMENVDVTPFVNFISSPSLTKGETEFFPGHHWFHEQIANQEGLLIAAGDAWTRGDTLYEVDTDTSKIFEPNRVIDTYGYMLATRLESDFIRIAKNFGENFQTYTWLIKLLPNVVSKYKKINVVWTLTETNVTYTDWLADIKQSASLNDFFEQSEKLMFDNIYKNLIAQYPTVNFIIGRNFTYSWETNKSILGPSLCDKTWTDCLALNQTLDPYPSELRMLSSTNLDALEQKLKDDEVYDKFKDEFLTCVSDAAVASDWLINSKFNHNTTQKNPTDIGHQIWAEYLNTIIQRCL